MDGWVGGLGRGLMDEQMNEESMDKCGWIDGWTGGWIDGWTGG
jgi:hypothetical protein